jgi:divalent metal cation (Fe/Co/Zn/Cd) transporter
MRKSVRGLLDKSIPPKDMYELKNILDSFSENGIQFHAIRTRQAGARKFISFHVLVPGDWSVNKGHQFLEKLENDIRKTLSNTTVFTHLESLSDPASWDDVELDRSAV